MINNLARLMHSWRQATAGMPGYADRRQAYELVIRAHWRALLKEGRTP